MVELKRLTADDLATISNIVTGDHDLHGVSNIGATLGKLLRKETVPEGVEFFAIVHCGVLVGVRYIRPQEEGVETGVWIMPQHRRCGHATASLKALIEKIRKQYTLVMYIYIYVDKTKNYYACKAPLSCKFRETGRHVPGNKKAQFFSEYILTI